jgi:hypothetical protein
MIRSRSGLSAAPVGYRFPREVIAVAVRLYLRYGLSSRDVEELLTERGIEVDHVTIYRWVQTFTPEFIDAARPARHAAGDRRFLDEPTWHCCVDRSALEVATFRRARPFGYRAAASSSKAMRTRSFGRRSLPSS